MLEAQTQIELIQLRTLLGNKDEVIRRADETIAALKLALEIENARVAPLYGTLLAWNQSSVCSVNEETREPFGTIPKER